MRQDATCFSLCYRLLSAAQAGMELGAAGYAAAGAAAAGGVGAGLFGYNRGNYMMDQKLMPQCLGARRNSACHDVMCFCLILLICIRCKAALVEIQRRLQHGLCADRSVQRGLGRPDNPHYQSNARVCRHCWNDCHNSHSHLLSRPCWAAHPATTGLVHGPHDGECWRRLHLARSYHVAGHARLPACKRSNYSHAHAIRQAAYSRQLDA